MTLLAAGRVLRFAQLMKVPDADRDYIMGLHFNTHVDAKQRPDVLARYINDNLVRSSSPHLPSDVCVSLSEESAAKECLAQRNGHIS